MRLFHWLILFAFILSSCAAHDNFLKDIDNIKEDLQNSRASYNVDSSFVANIRQDIRSRSKLNYDYSNGKLNSALIEFGNIDKTLKQAMKMDRIIRSDYAKTIDQLNNLYYDVDNNILKESEFRNYISDEKQIAKSIIDRMDFNQKRISSEIAKYDSLKVIIVNQAY